jgi:hypothetical protein
MTVGRIGMVQRDVLNGTFCISGASQIAEIPMF